jgi:hypothetical protein
MVHESGSTLLVQLLLEDLEPFLLKHFDQILGPLVLMNKGLNVFKGSAELRNCHYVILF